MKKLIVIAIALAISCKPAKAPTVKVSAPDTVSSKEGKTRMLRICWGEMPDSPTELRIALPCEDGLIPVLPAPPIKVLIDPKIYGQTRLAMDEWNLKVGFELFVGIKESMEAYDVVVFKAAPHPTRAGITMFGEMGGRQQRGIAIHTNSDQMVDVIIHELGHALGLRHVENPNSIMYRGIMKDLKQTLSKKSIDTVKLYYKPVK